MQDMDVMEHAASDVVTLTHRFLATYRRTGGKPEAVLARYSASVRELLDAAACGPDKLARIESELMLAA